MGAIACPLYRLRKVETFAQSWAARNTRMKPGLLKPKAGLLAGNKQVVASRRSVGSTPFSSPEEHRNYCLGREWMPGLALRWSPRDRRLGWEGGKTHQSELDGLRPLGHHRPLNNFLGLHHQKGCCRTPASAQLGGLLQHCPSCPPSRAPLIWSQSPQQASRAMGSTTTRDE